MWKKIVNALNKMLNSCWQLPMGAAALLVIAVLVGELCLAVGGWLGTVPDWMLVLGVLPVVAFHCGVAGGLLVPLWLVLKSIKWWRLGEVKRVLHCWMWSGVAALVALGVGMHIVRSLFEPGTDYFILGVEIPEDKEFVFPRGLYINIPAPKQVEKLRELSPEWPPLPTGSPELAAPNLQKLSRVAPELLQEYMLRCLYAEATSLRFSSPALGDVWPGHANDPQTQAHGAGRYDSHHQLLPLYNGWDVHCVVSWPSEWEGSPLQYAAEVQRLDAEFAALAQNPTREQLDALLPPVPSQPFLCMWADQAGIYDMHIVVPTDYAEGQFELRAYEYSCKKPIQFDTEWRPEMRLGNVCRLICSIGPNTVFSGDMGQYYGSVWEIWFTPEDGGEARCVNSQLFLMEGWQR